MSDQRSVWEMLVDEHPNRLSVVVATAGQTLQDVSKGLVQVFSGHGLEVADMIDRKAAESAQTIDRAALRMVDRFPNQAGVVGTTFGATVAQGALLFGRGLADNARLGSGLASGTLKGTAEDALRLFTVLGPAMKGLQTLRLRGISQAFVDPAPNLGICVPVAVTKAFRQAGQHRVFVRLSEMVKGALTHPIARESLDSGRALREMAGDLGRLGARFHFGQISPSVENLTQAVRSRPNTVAVFTAHWKQWNPSTKAFENVGHSMCAFLDGLGRFQIGDRTRSVVSSLGELDQFYPGVASATIGRDILFVSEARYLTALGQSPGIGLAVNAAAVGAKRTKSGSSPRH